MSSSSSNLTERNSNIYIASSSRFRQREFGKPLPGEAVGGEKRIRNPQSFWKAERTTGQSRAERLTLWSGKAHRQNWVVSTHDDQPDQDPARTGSPLATTGVQRAPSGNRSRIFSTGGMILIYVYRHNLIDL